MLMYHHYFGLQEPAFAIAVNPKYLYLSRQHKEAIAHIVFGIQGGGFVLLSGEVGTGKTTIIRQVLNQLPENTEIAFILNPMAEVDALLASICEELRISYVDDTSSTKQMMDAIQDRLLYNFSHGKRTVLLIDEAQLLSAEVLEQIRLLTNLETDTEKLMQIILVGQPEINDLLSQPRLRQLSQRITARFNLTPLNITETKNYIQHRLKVAGLKDKRELFPAKIIKRIHRFSGGVPRLINIVCERSLVGAYAHSSFQVDYHVFNLALNEIKGVKHQERRSKWIIPASVLGLFTLAACVLIYFSLFNANDQQKISSEVSQQPSTALETTTRDLAKKNTPETKATEPLLQLTAPATSSSQPLYASKNDAYRVLFQYHNVETSEESHPCWQTKRHSLVCTTQNIETWDEFKEINRPAILSVITKDRLIKYVVVLGIVDSQVLVANTDASLSTLAQSELGELWNGNVLYLWRKPPGFSDPITEGSKSPTVAWVANQLAIIDQQDKPITGQVFSPLLRSRIEIFQANHGLNTDGVIGEQTIMKINEQAGVSPVLLKSIPEALRN